MPACPPHNRCAAAYARTAPAATALPPAASKDCVAAHTRSPIQHLVAGPARGGFEHPDKAGRWHAHAPVVPLPEPEKVSPVR
jgi:hypothetical protein